MMTENAPSLSLEEVRLSDAVEFIRSAQTYMPRGTILNFFGIPDLEVWLSGPAGTGKSRGILEWIHFLLLRYPGARALILRKTRVSLNEAGLFTYEKYVLGEDHPIVGSKKREHRHKYIYPNGSELVTGGMDKPTRLFSTEYDLIYPQEANELALDEYESLLRALRNGVVPY